MEDIEITTNEDNDLVITIGDGQVCIEEHVIERFIEAMSDVISVDGGYYKDGVFLGFEREHIMTKMNIQYFREWEALNNLRHNVEWECPVCKTSCQDDECPKCGVTIEHLEEMNSELVYEDVDVAFSFSFNE